MRAHGRVYSVWVRKSLKIVGSVFKRFFQYRSYDQNILGRLGGGASFEFIPYSMHVRDYHNAINILNSLGRAHSGSVTFNWKWNFTDRHAFESLNELGRIKHDTLNSPDEFYWHRQSFNYCPSEELPGSCLKLYVANRVLETAGLERSFFETGKLFKRTDIFGIEAVIYL